MHPEAITSRQKEILKKLPVPPNFYLVGGTALALQIGHRISVDFDFFSSKSIPSNLLDRLQSIFGAREVEVVLNVSYQLTGRIKGVEVTYFRYSFPPLFPYIVYDTGNCSFKSSRYRQTSYKERLHGFVFHFERKTR